MLPRPAAELFAVRGSVMVSIGPSAQCVSTCVRACVRACVRVCVCARVLVPVRVCWQLLFKKATTLTRCMCATGRARGQLRDKDDRLPPDLQLQLIVAATVVLSHL